MLQRKKLSIDDFNNLVHLYQDRIASNFFFINPKLIITNKS